MASGLEAEMDPELKRLKDELAANAKQARDLIAAAEAEGRELTDDEKSTIDVCLARCEEIKATEIPACEARIDACSRLDAYDAVADAPQPRVSRPGSPTANGPGEPNVLGPAFRDDPQMGFAHVGEFAQCVHAGGPQEHFADERLAYFAAAGTAHQYGQSDVGGALVPPAFSQTIWQGLQEDSNSLVAMADSVTVPYGVESLSFPATNETSRANGSRHGGIQGYWKAEETQMQETRGSFRKVKFEPNELYVFAYVDDKLLKHGTALASWLPGAARDEINFKLGDSIINGTGAGMPTAIIGHTSAISVAKETGQAAATILAKNIDKMWARLHSRARARAVWLINLDVEPQLEELVQEVGVGGVPLFRPANGLTGAPNDTLKNRPIIPIEYCATLGTVGDIILCDMDYYAVATRGAVQEASSIHLKFDYNQTAFRFIFEADGQPWTDSAISAFKGNATYSPFVTLATRS